jgi:hemerythrin-like domain-containing protein
VWGFAEPILGQSQGLGHFHISLGAIVRGAPAPKGENAMMPIGPLMIEHRLIERMIDVLRTEAGTVAEQGTVHPVLLDSAVDFIRTYADRTHHGKEEDILFRDLAEKDLSAQDRAVMEELVHEHVYARRTVRGLVEAQERYLGGDVGAIAAIVEQIEALVGLYPSHIEKEDKVFFPAAMHYLSRSEQDAMLEEMWTFDRGMIHEKYRSVVERFEQSRG